MNYKNVSEGINIIMMIIIVIIMIIMIILWGISRDEAVNESNNFVLQMDFGPNKRPIEVIKEGAFGITYFRNIYSNVNKKWYKKS